MELFKELDPLLGGVNLRVAWQFDQPARHKGMVEVFRCTGGDCEIVRVRLCYLQPPPGGCILTLLPEREG